MSKSSKSARHSDDKNFPRKITNAPQKLIFEGNSKLLHDLRNCTASATTKQTNVAGGKKFKSKLRSPSKLKTLQIPLGTNQVIQPQTTSSKNINKRLSLAPFPNSKYYNTMKIHQDSSEAMVAYQTKASKKDTKPNKQVTTKSEDNVGKEKEPKNETAVESVVISNSNGKSAESELPKNASDQSTVATHEKVTIEPGSNENCAQLASETENMNNQNVNENNLNGHEEEKPVEVESDEAFEKLEYNETIITEESEKENELKKDDDQNKEGKPLATPRVEDENPIEKLSKEENATDQVGSTTTESSPVKNTENQANERDHTAQVKETNDSFIMYNSKIMLKDVKIKLNDCLKENSKLLDITTDANASMTDSLKDLSFGRTLRSISGRSSLRRMRHVTVRERLLTPNDSLFVNTSGTSLLQDQSQNFESNADSPYHYSSRYDRKRKLNEDMNDSMKKIKTDESYGLFNTSLEYLKSLRKPLQISTPNAHGYKINIDEKKDTNDDQTIVMEETAGMKKWCIIM